MGVFKKKSATVFTVLSLMQHLVAFLPFMQRNGSYLLIEKGADAWYYVITEGELTRTTKQTKEEKQNAYNSYTLRRIRTDSRRNDLDVFGVISQSCIRYGIREKRNLKYEY